jgi:hypothetical protein
MAAARFASGQADPADYFHEEPEEGARGGGCFRDGGQGKSPS